jgi:hypothetical protein
VINEPDAVECKANVLDQNKQEKYNQRPSHFVLVFDLRYEIRESDAHYCGQHD